MTESRRWMHFLRIFLLGAVLSLAWGAVSWLLHLDRIFTNSASERLFSVSLPKQIVLYGFVSPFVEELVFRQFLFSLLRRLFSPKVSAVIASAAFALWHGNMLQILYAFPMGILFQYLKERDNTLISPVCCHSGANLCAVIAQACIIVR